MLVKRSRIARGNGGDAHRRLITISESSAEIDVSPRHSAQVGSEVLGDEEMTHQLLRQRINEGFARQQIVNSLIEGVVLAHENLALASDALPLLAL